MPFKKPAWSSRINISNVGKYCFKHQGSFLWLNKSKHVSIDNLEQIDITNVELTVKRKTNIALKADFIQTAHTIYCKNDFEMFGKK